MEISIAAKSFPSSGVRKMFEKASRYDDAINMALGEPCFVTPKHIIEAGVEQLFRGKTKYAANAGIYPLREAIAEKLQAKNGIRCSPDNIIVTFGAVEALMLAMITLVNPGDEVIIPDPAWPDYMGQVKMVHGIPVGAEVGEENEFKMTADIIEPLITPKTKMIIINSPNNPTGAVLNREELREIAELVKRHKVYVISDEPYERLIYDNEEHVSLASFDGLEDYILTINTFSKTYAMTGWRLGYACANRDIISHMIKLQENNGSCVNEAFQYAGIYALKNGDKDVEYMLSCYKKNRALIVDGINQLNGFSCLMPKGAFYVFPKITELGMNSDDAADFILEKTHVVTSPGSAFGAAGEGHIRISFANDYNTIEKALDRMKQYFGMK